MGKIGIEGRGGYVAKGGLDSVGGARGEGEGRGKGLGDLVRPFSEVLCCLRVICPDGTLGIA